MCLTPLPPPQQKMAPRKGKEKKEEQVISLGPQVAEGENVFGVCHIFASFNDTFVHVTDLSGKYVPFDRLLAKIKAALIGANGVCVCLQGDDLPCDRWDEGEGGQRRVFSVRCHVGGSGRRSALQRARHHGAAHQVEGHRRQQVTCTHLIL